MLHTVLMEQLSVVPSEVPSVVPKLVAEEGNECAKLHPVNECSTRNSAECSNESI